MKKLISFLIAIIAIVSVNAQSTSPRWGSAKNEDNTGAVLTWKYTTVSDAIGADSVIIAPNAYTSVYKFTVVDSIYFKTPVLKNSYLGDNISLIATGSTGGKIKFASTNLVTSGTATLSSGGKAVIKFIFDGAKWIESDRSVF